MSNLTFKDFVAEALKSVVEGVSEAQDYSARKGLVPIDLHSVGEERVKFGEQLVCFSIAVEVNRTETTEKSGSFAAIISVVSASIGGKNAKENRDASSHGIEFSVPVHFDSRWASDKRRD